MDSRRAESFSDGVFAVAITVLVFNLLPIADKTVNPPDGTGLTFHTLWTLHWPAYLAYLVSFLTIGIMWLNHHTMLSAVTRVNRAVLVLNLFLLMGVVAIPFPTALVADHLDGSGAGRVAAVSYGLVMIAISIGYASTWIYLAAHQAELDARRRVVAAAPVHDPVHGRERRLRRRDPRRGLVPGRGADHLRPARGVLPVRPPAVGGDQGRRRRAGRQLTTRTGSQTRTLVPLPGLDSSVACPPCAVAMACTIDKPRPLPPGC